VWARFTANLAAIDVLKPVADFSRLRSGIGAMLLAKRSALQQQALHEYRHPAKVVLVETSHARKQFPLNSRRLTLSNASY